MKVSHFGKLGLTGVLMLAWVCLASGIARADSISLGGSVGATLTVGQPAMVTVTYTASGTDFASDGGDYAILGILLLDTGPNSFPFFTQSFIGTMFQIPSNGIIGDQTLAVGPFGPAAGIGPGVDALTAEGFTDLCGSAAVNCSDFLGFAGIVTTSGAITWVTPTAVPEPGTLSMLLTGMLGSGLLVGLKRYRGNRRTTEA